MVSISSKSLVYILFLIRSYGHLVWCIADVQVHFLKTMLFLQRNSAGSENPSDAFRFLVEERVQCCQSRRVRYTQRVDYCIQLPAPIEAATNRGKGAHTHARCCCSRRPQLPLVSTAAWPWASVAPAAGKINRLWKGIEGPDMWLGAVDVQMRQDIFSLSDFCLYTSRAWCYVICEKCHVGILYLTNVV